MADKTLTGGGDDFGPFTGYEIAHGLVCLGWTLRVPQDDFEAPELRNDEVGSEIHLDWREKNIMWGKRPFELYAELMVSRGVTGRPFKKEVTRNALDLLMAVRRFKEKRKGARMADADAGMPVASLGRAPI